ncbi:membrane protein [Lysinibacillus sp. PLM2]|nr:membrane protein [Lysinibacillus sp. PLM2]
MLVELTALHWIYVLFIVLIIGFMVMRRDTTLISTLGIFLIAIVATADFTASVSGVFKSFVFATTELLSTILIICIIVAMSKVLQKTGINEVMVTPFTKIFKSPGLAFWTIGILMMVISWFFWPSPAVALLGAVMLPVAIRAGLPALGVAMAMNLFGHGIALSSDFIIQGAPKLTADAAGIPVTDVVMASIPLVIVMGAVTTLVAFILLKREMKRGSMEMVGTFDGEHVEEKPEDLLSLRQKQIFAVLIPVAFILDVVAMAVFNLSGGDATAIVGGTAILILLILSMFAYKNGGLEKTTSHLIEGFQFGFKVFGPVIPIAAFFYMGDAGFTTIIGDFLPTDSQGIVNDLGIALASVVPLTSEIAAITLTGVGAITGLDGSGFSGITLAGSIANLFGTAIESGTATLTALGQIAAIWVGGGTLVPWALIPAAAICNVSPFELARRNLIPVVVGLIVTTIVAMFII